MSWITFEETVETNYVIPVLIFIVGCIIESISWTIQKQSQIDTIKENRSYINSGMWWCGLATRMLSGFICFVSLGFAPASLLQPLKSVTIALNVISARIFFKEPLNWVHIVSILIIIIGVTLSVIYGPKPPVRSYNADDIIELYQRDRWVLLISSISGIILILFVLSIIFEFKLDMDSETYEHWITRCCIKKHKNDIKKQPSKMFRRESELELFALNDIKLDYSSNFKKYINITDNKIDSFLIFSLPCIASYFGSWCQLFSKTMMEIVTNSFESKENAKLNWTHYITYLIIIFWFVCIILAEKYKQRGLRKYGMVYIASIFQVLVMVGAAVFGGVFFMEFDSSTSTEKIVYMCSIIITFIGVGVLTFKSTSDVEEEIQRQITIKEIEMERIIKKTDDEHQNLVNTNTDIKNGENETKVNHS